MKTTTTSMKVHSVFFFNDSHKFIDFTKALSWNAGLGFQCVRGVSFTTHWPHTKNKCAVLNFFQVSCKYSSMTSFKQKVLQCVYCIVLFVVYVCIVFFQEKEKSECGGGGNTMQVPLLQLSETVSAQCNTEPEILCRQ